MPTMLIADDNRQISSVLQEYAKKEGYTVLIAHDGQQALNFFNKEAIDVLLLDVMMPVMDGFEVCRKIRETSNLPIIMVTARGEDFERIMGLDIGADDYIVKPFSPGEVMARVRAVMRRIAPAEHSEDAKSITTFAGLCVNMATYTATLNGTEIALTKKEMELLWTLVTTPGRVYTRDNLLDLIWGYDYFGDNRTVDSHIKRLRAKLDALPHPMWEISTIWGVGYKFEVLQHEK